MNEADTRSIPAHETNLMVVALSCEEHGGKVPLMPSCTARKQDEVNDERWMVVGREGTLVRGVLPLVHGPMRSFEDEGGGSMSHSTVWVTSVTVAMGRGPGETTRTRTSQAPSGT
jgi:hypothetical protein